MLSAATTADAINFAVVGKSQQLMGRTLLAYKTCCVVVLVEESMPAHICACEPPTPVSMLQDGVTGFHAGQIDPDDLLQTDVSSFADTMKR